METLNQREIKFRAWDGKNMYMSPSTLEVLHHLGSWFEAHSEFGYTKKENNNAIIMQYTGLKDKNGKEIYEGDILNVPYNRIGNQLVKWEYGEWSIKNYLLRDCEVIGNIYQKHK